MDFLEKKIKEQRAEFDHIERVDEGMLWQNIQAGLNPPRQKKSGGGGGAVNRFLRFYAVAASVALLMMAGWLFSNNKNTETEIAEIQTPLLPSFQEEESYRQTVSEKMENLDFENLNRNRYRDIFYELELLEKVHEEFREDLPLISEEERAVHVLRKYYERKIRILERLSKEIEKKAHHEKRINEKPI